MRRVLLAVVALFVTAAPGWAQGGPGAPAEKMADSVQTPAAEKPAAAPMEAAKPAAAPTEAAKPAAPPQAGMKPATAATAGPQVAVLETALGTIVIKFDETDAPKTVANFKKLVSQGFYNGTYFHRVIPGFMIQGGDPNTRNADPNDDGIGGPGYTVPAEIKAKHVRGAVATARTNNPEKASSGSQFFIDVAPQPSLDAGGYTVFGNVISGMDAVDKIVALGADPSTPRGPGGPNPGKKALITKAYLAPLAKYQK